MIFSFKNFISNLWNFLVNNWTFILLLITLILIIYIIFNFCVFTKEIKNISYILSSQAEAENKVYENEGVAAKQTPSEKNVKEDIYGRFS